MSTFRLKDTYKLMSFHAKTISENVFADSRPKIINDKMDDFVVVSMPVMLYDKLMGTGDGMVTTYVRYDVFVRDVKGVENLPKITTLVEKLMNSFPQLGDNIKIFKPRVAMKGTDLHDFHYACIQASLIIY